MSPAFLTTFPRQLRYWTFHCCLNALPSFGLALVFLKLWNSPLGIMAMLAAIGTFILLYASITSLGPFGDDEHTLSRALHMGARIRGWMSAASLAIMPLGGMVFVPDFWCGFISAQIISSTLELPGTSGDFELLTEGKGGFLSIYLTTLLEGFMLSGILLFISFIAVMILQARGRRRFFGMASDH
ncbi:MAG: hypothetical protein EOP87_26785 [Verrucomicrobiaceae bacterium]|nr:MAG: hypothetical protein EOP87_26785 [Verrucomicrobiaceae bacterium]